MSMGISRRVSVVALLSALTLTACSGEEAPGSSAPDPTEETREAEPVEVTTESETTEPIEAETVAEAEPSDVWTDGDVRVELLTAWTENSPEARVSMCERLSGFSDEDVVAMTGESLGIPDPSEFSETILLSWEGQCGEIEPASPEVPNYQVGDLIESPSADITVNVLEERDSITASSNMFYPSGAITPGEDERLWYVDITWTNNSTLAVGKECHGPYSMDLRAYDLEGREMLMVDQPGMIEGQECSTGLMQGQTGTWLSAFHGLDEDFGWMVFDDYEGGQHIVVMDPHVTVSRANR